MTARQLAGALVAVHAIAGAVGSLRHLRERQRGASGTHTLGPLTGWLAGWLPASPRTLAGRVAAWAWAAPLTGLGALVAATSGGRWRWDAGASCVVVSGGGRGVARLQRRLGIAAVALGHVVVAHADPVPPRLLAHETVHVRQAERLGPLLATLYLLLYARYGYRRHPLELAARSCVTTASLRE